MRIIKAKTVLTRARQYARAAVSLTGWLLIAKKAEWKSLAEVRATYASADEVKVASKNKVVVFNTGGNEFRLIAAVHYKTKIVYVLRFLTHAEYDKERWKHEL